MKYESIEKIRTVIDTNVIISAAISEDGNAAKIFELLLLELIENYTGSEIISEVNQVFNRSKIKKVISKVDMDFILNNYCKFSRKTTPKNKFSIIKEDPKDNMILDCAVESISQVIISGDQHLLKLKKFKNTLILSPREFIEFTLK